MSKQIKALGIDFGNSTISVAGFDKQGEIKKDYIDSIYSFIPTTDTLTVGNVVSVIADDGVEVRLQLGEDGETELANNNKVDREYLAHQILWSAHAIYGAGNHDISIGAGLPITELGNAKLKARYEENLKKIKTIKGSVDGEEIQVTIDERVEVFGEGSSAVVALGEYISKVAGVSTTVIDIGQKTTDVSVVTYENGKFKVSKPLSIPKGLDSIYKPILEDLKTLGAVKSMKELDLKVQKDIEIIRTEEEGEDYNLAQALKERKQECVSIINAVDVAIGKNTNDRILIGGGGAVVGKILKENKVKIARSVDVPTEIKYYANAIGYLRKIAKKVW